MKRDRSERPASFDAKWTSIAPPLGTKQEREAQLEFAWYLEQSCQEEFMTFYAANMRSEREERARLLNYV